MSSGGKRSTTWTKGTNPVKKKGTKRKATLLKEAFGVKTWAELQQFVETKGLEKLTFKMNRLKPKDYAIVFLSLCEFVKPKLQRTTIEGGDPDKPVQVKITLNL